VVTDLYGIERKFLQQPGVHGLDDLKGLLAGRDIGLVGNDDIE